MVDKREAETTAGVVIDVRALACPASILRVKRALQSLGPGARATVLCADAVVALDVEVWARTHSFAVDAAPADAMVRVRVPMSTAPAEP